MSIFSEFVRRNVFKVAAAYIVVGWLVMQVAELLVEAGVGAILNFAPVTLDVPGHITVRRVDLATELRILSYHLARARL